MARGALGAVNAAAAFGGVSEFLPRGACEIRVDVKLDAVDEVTIAEAKAAAVQEATQKVWDAIPPLARRPALGPIIERQVVQQVEEAFARALKAHRELDRPTVGTGYWPHDPSNFRHDGPPQVGTLGVLPDDARPMVGVYEDTTRDEQRPTVGAGTMDRVAAALGADAVELLRHFMSDPERARACVLRRRGLPLEEIALAAGADITGMDFGEIERAAAALGMDGAELLHRSVSDPERTLQTVERAPQVGVTAFHDQFVYPSSEQPETDGLATWYEVSRDAADGYGTPRWPSWRCQVPARHLPAVVLRAGAPLDAQRGAVAVLQVPDPEREEHLRERGVRIVCDVDDSEWYGKRQWLKLQTLGPFTGGRAAVAAEAEVIVQRRLSELRGMDAVTCPTAVLARRMARFNDHVMVVRSAVDPDDWPTPERPGDGVFRIGFHGSLTHMADLSLVVDALSWAAGQDGVEVVMVGPDPRTHMVMDDELDDETFEAMIDGAFGTRNREAETRVRAVQQARQDAWSFPFTHFDWIDVFADFRAALATLDVGVCPIKRWESIGRADSKPLELAMCGALPIVSDEATFIDFRGTSALFAKHPADFQAQVRWTVEHRDEVRERARLLREHVLAERSIHREIVRWRDALGVRGDA
jgi:hypothetical protein